jgi:hypothetical protein
MRRIGEKAEKRRKGGEKEKRRRKGEKGELIKGEKEKRTKRDEHRTLFLLFSFSLFISVPPILWFSDYRPALFSDSLNRAAPLFSDSQNVK